MTSSDSSNGSPPEAPGFEFPCEFPVKAMGRTDTGFEHTVVDVVSQHVDPVDLLDITTRPSAKGNFVSVTCLILARSREQLDAIYDSLTAHPDVLMRL